MATPDRAKLDLCSQLTWNVTPTRIEEIADELIQASTAAQDAVAAITEGHTFANTIQPLATLESDPRFAVCYFPSYVSGDKATRDASTAANERLEQHDIDSKMRADVFAAVQAFAATDEAAALSGEDARLLARVVRDFERNGLSLAAEPRAELKALLKRASQLSISFQQNLNEDTTKAAFSAAQLDGMSEAWLSALPRDDDGKYVVSLKYPELMPLLKNCKVVETRKAMERLSGERCLAENVPLFEEMIANRAKRAELLGFATHADFMLDIRMAKKPERVAEFLSDLKDKLTGAAQADLAKLEARKAQDVGADGDTRIYAWDWLYYAERVKEEEHSLNAEEVQQYFPYEHVLDSIFSLYQGVLGMRFEQVTDAPVWHEDVSMFAVYDAASDDFLGHFYLDMFPRDGKYGHAAVFPLQSACERADGTRQYPVAAMVCNFTKPTESRPSLLRHDEVVTCMHEAGHMWHNVLGHCKYGRFSGTSVERDFVEAPSQANENWAWDAGVLTGMSKHVKDGSPLPASLIDRMLAAKLSMSGMRYRRQLFFGLFDLAVHQAKSVDSAKLWADMRDDITLIPNTPGTNGAASFGHLMGGYDVGYYGYLYSEVFSCDIFEQFKHAPDGVTSPAVGRRYRDHILARGGSVDGSDMLRNFLGRDPKPDAFLASIGLGGGDE